MLSRFLQPQRRDFDSLDEREILSLAVAAEEEDGAIYSEIAHRLNNDPEILARRKRAAKEMYRDPALREKRRQNANERWADPEQRAAMLAGIRQVFIDNPDTRRLRSENTKRQWQRVKAKRAREAEEAAMLATMTPFERKLWLIDTGRARITERPVLRAAEYHRTMGGVAEYGA